MDLKYLTVLSRPHVAMLGDVVCYSLTRNRVAVQKRTAFIHDTDCRDYWDYERCAYVVRSVALWHHKPISQTYTLPPVCNLELWESKGWQLPIQKLLCWCRYCFSPGCNWLSIKHPFSCCRSGNDTINWMVYSCLCHLGNGNVNSIWYISCAPLI